MKKNNFAKKYSSINFLIYEDIIYARVYNFEFCS